MARRQLEDDMYNVESEDDFDHEEDVARLEHYQMHGNRPRLMPDVRMREVQFLRHNIMDSVYG